MVLVVIETRHPVGRQGAQDLVSPGSLGFLGEPWAIPGAPWRKQLFQRSAPICLGGMVLESGGMVFKGKPTLDSQPSEAVRSGGLWWAAPAPGAQKVTKVLVVIQTGYPDSPVAYVCVCVCVFVCVFAR